MDEYLLSNECRSLSVSNECEIMDLGYADDFVFLSDSPLEVNRKLEILDRYCRENYLTVNTEKIKVVIFTRSGNASARRFKSFKLGTKNIEVVEQYTYLGIPFSGSGSFFPAANGARGAANLAIGGIMNIIYATGADSWATYQKLFQSLSVRVLFYGVQVWGSVFFR